MNMGYSHRTSFLIIYAFSIFFGCMAIIFNSATLLTSLIILGVIFIGIQLISEMAGITFFTHQPMLNRLKRVTGSENKCKFNRFLEDHRLPLYVNSIKNCLD